MLNQLSRKFVNDLRSSDQKMNAFYLAPDATCQFTLILTGTKIGQAKVELPFKLDGIDDYGYLHVEADITVGYVRFMVQRKYWVYL